MDAETEFAQVAALVLERHRIDDRVVRRRQAVGGHHHLRRRLALAHVAEHRLRLFGHDQVRRLQQHLLLRAADQRFQFGGGGCIVVAAFAAVLLRQIGDIAHRAHREGGLDETLPYQVRIARLGARRLHALRPQVARHRHRRHALAQQGAADIVQALGGHAAPRLPERLEIGRHRRRLRTRDQHVAVAEVVFGVPVEVVVLVVAPAADADAVVHQQQLGMHALVEAAEAAQHAARVVQVVQLGLAEAGVVDADGKVLVRTGQRGQDLQVGDRRQLVDQHPHLHPAPRCGQQLVQHQPRAVVLVEDVGLQVDAFARAADQVQPCQQRVRALIQDHRVVARRLRGGRGARLSGQVVERRRQRAGIGLFALDHR